MTSYSKPHLTYQQQIELLENRGLIINNKEFAIIKLQHISYYRLSAYFLPFQSKKDRFDEGITFETLIDLYHFDKELRILTFNAIEKIEIFLRASVAYNFSKHHQVFGYVDKENFCCDDMDFDWLTNDITKETSRSKETFVKHFRDNYDGDNLPIWMVVEIVSFGTLSKLYTMLCSQTEKEILNGINLPSFVFKNWLHLFSYVRMYDDMEKEQNDNPTIGIILCADKDNTVVKYSVLNDNENLFVSKYKLYLPSEAELKAEIERDVFELQREIYR